MCANKKHKSSVFYELFSEPDVFKELYSAIEGINIPPGTPMKDNTLSGALFMGRVNDIAFTIDNRLVVLVEHQSTMNHNMPLRLLMYIGRVYEQIIDFDRVYQQKQIKIPTPEFIVLYNGTEPCPDHQEVRLSQAFRNVEGLKLHENSIPLDLVVQVYNINHGHNRQILEKCATLDNYSTLISKIREFNKENSLEEAAKAAVKYCIEHNILEKFLKKYGSEVMNMLFGEYNFDRALEVRYEEGVEDGIEKEQEYVLGLIAQGLTVDEIQRALEAKCEKALI
jgi:hypothetical protein